MPNYQLIQTGITIAELTLDTTNRLTIKLRDFISGDLGSNVPFDPIIHGEFLDRYTRAPLTELLNNFANYQALVQSASTSGTTIIDGAQRHFEKANETLWVGRHQLNPIDLVVDEEILRGFIFTNREFTTFLIEEGYDSLTALSKWQASNMLVTHPSAIHYHGTFETPMRDGINLSTIVYLPDDVHLPCPIIFSRTPYGKELYCENHFRFVQRGYGVVIQDTRGRNDSEGEFTYCGNEQDDGEDALAWIAAQTWSDGNIGMFGASYGGYVQWSAAASGTPHLKAIVSTVTAGGPFTDVTRKGGTHSSALAWWFAMSQKKFDKSLMMRNDWDQLMKIRPLEKLPEAGLGYQIPAFNELLSHDAYDDYFEKIDWYQRRAAIKIPALIISGWFDDNEAGSTEAIDTVSQYPAETSKIILGPWLHNGNSRRNLGNMDLGTAAVRHDIDFLHLSWFDHFLKGIDNQIEESAPLEYYTIHENCWKKAKSWPPSNTTVQPFYLSSEQQLGQLTTQLPTSERTLDFTYDPQQPAPHLIDVSENELSFPNDYQEIEERADVLCFTSPILEKDVIVTGQGQLKFYAKSTAVNTDWVVRLTDVAPDGSSYQVAMSVLNARFRDDWRQPSLITSGKTYAYQLDLSKTSYNFKAGHKIRVHLTSSAENYIFTNSNTPKGVNTLESVVAVQTILTGPNFQSVLNLPIEN